MGIRSKRPQRSWTSPEQQRLLKLIDLHPVSEIARLMRRSRSSIWHMWHRLDANANLGKGGFTKYTLAVVLNVEVQRIENWIARGWLKGREIESGQARRTIILAEDFCDFCRKHTKDVIGNRLSKERLDFVCHFVFPPGHAELPVRESKKERNACDAQAKDKDEDEPENPPEKVPPKGSEESDDELEELA